jgi:hypothetical protein
VKSRGALRLVLLGAAAACVLAALRLTPAIRTGSEVGVQPSAIVNDTAAPVLVARCVHGCADPDQPVELVPGHSLRLGATSGPLEWLIESRAGDRIGCLAAPPPAHATATLRVSRARSCQGH